MPRLPAPPDGDRFFGRPEAGRNECPRCGYLDQWYTPGPVRGTVGPPKRWMVKRARERQKQVRGRERPNSWNPLTSQWTCPSCRMAFVVGLVFWPVQKGWKRSIPADQVPDYRQLGQLRAQSGGVWMREAVTGWRAAGTNICPRCTCLPGMHGTPQGHQACPLLEEEQEQEQEDP